MGQVTSPRLWPRTLESARDRARSTIAGYDPAVRRRAIWTLVAVVLVMAGALGGMSLYRHATYGIKYSEHQPNVAVSEGGIFTIVVQDRGPSVGDDWTASVSDETTISQIRSTLIPSSFLDPWFGPKKGGGGGQRLITFRAKAAGNATVTLRNCFQGCRDDRTRSLSRSVSWTVSVAR
jgi:inhibitor of cysteine peptidase